LKPRATVKKVVLDSDDNARLRQWQFNHLKVTWCERERPWEVEDAVIAVAPWGAETRSSCGGGDLVLVDEFAEHIVPSDGGGLRDGITARRGRDERSGRACGSTPRRRRQLRACGSSRA